MSVMETTDQARQHLTFLLAGEQYAVEILGVREIIRWERVTPVPSAPPAIRGVLNLRGGVVPVVDLGMRLGMGETAVTPRTCIIIAECPAESGSTAMGMMVDAVSQVMDLLPGEIEPPPTFGTGVRTDYLRGLARTGARFALVLDLARVLSPAELSGAVTAAAAAPVEMAA
jgi:purine-binding chemotaxis protein CheW